jgi:hypothetical protein
MSQTLRRIRRIVETQTAYSLWQAETLADLAGNPLGIAWRQLDAGAIALLARALPGPSHNRVVGLRGDLVAEVEPLLAWYAEAGIRPRLETISTYDDAALAGALVQRGYYQSGFQVVLAAAAGVAGGDPAAGGIEAVDGAGKLAAYLELHGLAARHAGEAARAAAPSGRLGARGISLYLRRQQGRPPAAAALFVKDGIGYCPPATATQGSGLDGALFSRRSADARHAGAEWVCTEADLMSARQASLTKMGFSAVFIRAQWSSLGGGLGPPVGAGRD